MALFSTSFFAKCLLVGEDGPGQGHLCHTDTFLVLFCRLAQSPLWLGWAFLIISWEVIRAKKKNPLCACGKLVVGADNNHFSPSFWSPLLSFLSLSLGDNTKWPTKVDVLLNPNSVNQSVTRETTFGTSCLLSSTSSPSERGQLWREEFSSILRG